MIFLLYLNVIISVVFSILLLVQNFSFNSVIASILGLAFSGALAFFSHEFINKKNLRGLNGMRRMLSYLALAMMAVFIISRAYLENSPYVMDILLAMLWFSIVVLSIITARILNEKRVHKYFPDAPEEGEKKRGFFSEFFEWVDAAVWALGIVFLLNIFIFQLYAIPSESMVPTFMIGDKVLGIKAASGPKFPLSSFRIPQLRKYKRGDVAIIRSPRYPITPESELKTFVSQLIYMFTFMQVNTNIDPATGKPKIDPLVKRIVGLPGEKIMLVDGILYKKTKSDTEFKPVKKDEEFAQWNLEELSPYDLRHVKRIPVKSEVLSRMESIEEKRKTVNFNVEHAEIEKALNEISDIRNKIDTVTDIDNFLGTNEYVVSLMFSSNMEIAEKILKTDGGLAWLRAFALSWTDSRINTPQKKDSLYELRCAQLNVLMKKNFVKLILRNIQLIAQNASIETVKADTQRQMLLTEADNYNLYLAYSYGRNMNVFPKETDSYIPENEYFMVGDNRFNSHDLRHGKTSIVPLDDGDIMPFVYPSNIDPQTLPAEKILGLAVFKFWPPSRFGAVK